MKTPAMRTLRKPAMMRPAMKTLAMRRLRKPVMMRLAMMRPVMKTPAMRRLRKPAMKTLAMRLLRKLAMMRLAMMRPAMKTMAMRTLRKPAMIRPAMKTLAMRRLRNLEMMRPAMRTPAMRILKKPMKTTVMRILRKPAMRNLAMRKPPMKTLAMRTAMRRLVRRLRRLVKRRPAMKTPAMKTPAMKTLVMRMVMKMQRMTNVNGKTGASGLADAARSLADALEFKLEAGPLTTSCLTRAAVDSSVQDGNLKLGPAKKKIVAKMPMMVRMRKRALMTRTRRITPTRRLKRMTPTTRMRRMTPTTRTRMSRRMVMIMQKMTNVNGKTGASGLVNAAHSLADVLAVKLVAGPLTTSCLIRAAADSSVPDVKLKLGPARNPIANQLNLRRANGETGASGLVDAGRCSAESMAVRRAQGGRPTTCRTDSAAAFSARGRKLNPGAAETPKLMFQNCDDFILNNLDTRVHVTIQTPPLFQIQVKASTCASCSNFQLSKLNLPSLVSYPLP